MPIYEYHCSTCDQVVELLVRSSDSTPHCPNCRRPLTDKLFSTPNILTGRTQRPPGKTCCGREERCETPGCAGDGGCRHD
jgi:putative FmdB family regulatory protein